MNKEQLIQLIENSWAETNTDNPQVIVRVPTSLTFNVDYQIQSVIVDDNKIVIGV